MQMTDSLIKIAVILDLLTYKWILTDFTVLRGL